MEFDVPLDDPWGRKKCGRFRYELYLEVAKAALEIKDKSFFKEALNELF